MSAALRDGRAPCAMVMAGGTGGHIFPGLALAEALRERGWRVHWFGGKGTAQRPSMESQLVPARGLPFDAIDFGGLRGKGLLTAALLPMRLLLGFGQSIALLRRIRPDVVIGLGGYITFPGGMMSVLLGKPLVLHEQNSVAGLANRVLAEVADRVYTAFPGVLKKAQWVGNPLRAAFLSQPAPAQRFVGRSGPLRLLVLGGSLGAQALNEAVPQALALLAPAQRPQVLHQSGAGHLEALQARYQEAGVQAELTAFIEDTASALAQADLVICRRCLHRDRDRRHRCSRRLRALSPCGRRSPEPQRDASGRGRRGLAHAAGHPERSGAGRAAGQARSHAIAAAGPSGQSAGKNRGDRGLGARL